MVGTDATSASSTSCFGGFLDIELVDVGLARGMCHQGAVGRAFGGQVAAQALVAAGGTVDSTRGPASLHALFLRPGDVDRPIVYQTESLHDGGTFSSRRVSARQNGTALATVSISFARPGPPSLVVETTPPSVPSPAESPAMLFDDGASAPSFNQVIEQRRAAWATPDRGLPSEKRWLRTLDPLPNDPLVHAAVLTYMSDIRLAATPVLGHRLAGEKFSVTSLDHSIRWVRPIRADRWFLFSQIGQSMHRGIAMASGDIFSETGRLDAHISQQSLIVHRPTTD